MSPLRLKVDPKKSWWHPVTSARTTAKQQRSHKKTLAFHIEINGHMLNKFRNVHKVCLDVKYATAEDNMVFGADGLSING